MLKVFGCKPTTASKIFMPLANQKRNFWEFVNMMFNKPDLERIKTLGPDRACAEWVLRNGGKIVWSNGTTLADYNLLPSEDRPVPKVLEIDGTDSSISHYGFPHLCGLTMLKKIVLHNGSYIDDRALQGLAYGKNTLTYIQVSKCHNVTDAGLKKIKVCDKLEDLVLFELTSVSRIHECVEYLKTHLPNCKIEAIY